MNNINFAILVIAIVGWVLLFLNFAIGLQFVYAPYDSPVWQKAYRSGYVTGVSNERDFIACELSDYNVCYTKFEDWFVDNKDVTKCIHKDGYQSCKEISSYEANAFIEDSVFKPNEERDVE